VHTPSERLAREGNQKGDAGTVGDKMRAEEGKRRVKCSKKRQQRPFLRLFVHDST